MKSKYIIRPDFAREWGVAVVKLVKTNKLMDAHDDGYRLESIEAIFYGKQATTRAKAFRESI